MAAQKFLTLVNGVIQLLSSKDTSAGAGDAGKLVALNASGKVDDTMMPAGIGADILVAPASETLTAGDFVNVWDDAGTVKVRKANATDNTKPANGFVKDGVSSGSNATVYFEGENDDLTSLTVGTAYYLGTTGGAVTATAPSATGNVVQYLGVAHATTKLRFEPKQPILLG